MVPEAILGELEVGEATHGKRGIVDALRGFAEFAKPVTLDPLLTVELDIGEASAIQTARELEIKLVLMDERKGRRVARRVYGLQTVGTARTLVEGKLHGHLPAVAPILDQMKAAGYWIADDIVAWARAAAGEQS